MILATDISNHFEQIMTFKSRCSSKKFPENNMEDKQLILNMTMYAADHANPTKSSILYFKWMAAEMEEYFQQGDLERKLDYSITAFYDRTESNPFKYQMGYIDVVVRPLMDTWCEFKPVFREELIVQGIQENTKLLETKIEETKNLILLQQQEKDKGLPEEEGQQEGDEDKDEPADGEKAGDGEQETNNNLLNGAAPQAPGDQ